MNVAPHRRRPALVWIAVACFAVLPALSAAGADCPIRFRDMTAQSGIAFEHTDGSSGRKYIVETVSAGLAAFDYNNSREKSTA